MMILTATIGLSMISAVLALVTFTYASSDPFATEESKPSCAEIEQMINFILTPVRKIGSNSAVLKRQKICQIYLVKCSLLNT